MLHSSPPRIGLIGCGGIVQKTHLPCLLRLGGDVNVVAVADPVAASRDAVADAAGVPPARRYEDFPALLKAGGLDLVLIATPHHIHIPAVTAAAAHNVAVICEKPLGHDLESSRRLVRTLLKAAIPFTVVHNFLFSPGNLRAQSLLRRGGSEKPCYGRGQSLFAKAAPLDPKEWRNQAATGGGTLNDTCYHEIYQMEALIGAPVVCVQARVDTVYHAITADDLVLLTLEHANGVISTVTSAWSVPGFEGSFCEVHTDLRTLRVEGRGRQFRVYDRATRTWQEEALGATHTPGIASGHFGFWQETLRALRERRPLPVPPHLALRQVELLEAARHSSANRGQPVDVELAAPKAILS
jgi:predicted dehydrogenase